MQIIDSKVDFGSINWSNLDLFIYCDFARGIEAELAWGLFDDRRGLYGIALSAVTGETFFVASDPRAGTFIETILDDGRW
jgi:hypothetical protein